MERNSPTASLADALARARSLLDPRPDLAAAQAREVLKVAPAEPDATLILGAALRRLGELEGAAQVLAPLVEAHPEAAIARYELALVFYRLGRLSEALEALGDGELSSQARNLRAAVLMALGEPERAAADYRAVLGARPAPGVWLALGHALKALGRQDEAVGAYRQALSLAPAFGEAYWSLANLKTVRFSPADLAAMQGLLAHRDLAEEDRIPLNFALGKALEDAGEDVAAFERYSAGARARRARQPYAAEANTAFTGRSIATFTAEFLEARTRQGRQMEGPIFVLGLPRSGSTLVEQILASHPEVEGVGELPDLTAIARRVVGTDPESYPACLASLAPAELAALGEAYLERAAPMRKLGRRLFVDKFPSNFQHIGLIRLILPKARIIDARRHPMACGFSAYRQLFAEGQAWSYDLADIGRYYRDYLDLMVHFDAVQPGLVHRVIYERLVEDPESEVRALLAHCGLSFDPRCLRFHETARTVRTASSEQVRRPLFRDGLDHWRRFETQLTPLAEALGNALVRWDEGRR